MNALADSYGVLNAGRGLGNQQTLNKDRSSSNNSSSLNNIGLSIDEHINALLMSHLPITPKALQHFI